MPTPANWPTLLRKDAGDEAALQVLAAQSAIPDAVIGFHAQQAIEKLLKAVLAFRGIVFPRTHNLVALFKLVRDHGIPLLPSLDDAMQLTPFAVESRYDDPIAENDEPLDRAWAVDVVQRVRLWATQITHNESNRSDR